MQKKKVRYAQELSGSVRTEGFLTWRSVYPTTRMRLSLKINHMSGGNFDIRKSRRT